MPVNIKQEEPFFLQFVKYYYLFLTFLVIAVPLKYDFIHFLPALVLMWSSFFLLRLGYFSKGVYNHVEYKILKPSKTKNRLLVAFTVFMMVFVPLMIKFYTGGNPYLLLLNFGSMVGADSNYYSYQEYFEANNLGVMSLQKLPYIVLNGFSALAFWFFCISYICFAKKVTLFQKCLLTVLFFLYFLQGLSRGTSFENFELLMISTFCALASRKIRTDYNFFSYRQMVWAAGFIFVGALYFIISKSLRYEIGEVETLKGPTSSLVYDPSGWTESLFPALGKFSLELSGYFVFPLYLTSEVFWHIWTTSQGFISAIIPFTADFFYSDPRSYAVTLEKYNVDRGACWVPDIMSAIYVIGVPLYFLLIYKLGRLSAKIYSKGIIYGDIRSAILLYIITLEAISLPVGNFIMTSSANQIALVLIIFIIYTNSFKELAK